MSLRSPNNGLASAVIFVCASFWGLYWLPLRLMEEAGIRDVWTVAVFNALPGLALLPFLRRTGGRQAVLVGLMAGTGMAFYASGLVLSSVMQATLLFYLTPVWSTLIGRIWLGERVGWHRWTAIAIGLTGMALLLSGGAEDASLNLGDLLALLSGVFWGIAAALIRHFGSAPLVPMAFWQFFFASLVAALSALTLTTAPLPAMTAIVETLPISLTGAIGIMLPTLLAIFWMQKFVSPGRSGLLMMSEVLVAAVSASLLLPEEAMRLIEWVGAAMIVSACLLEVLAPPGQTGPDPTRQHPA